MTNTTYLSPKKGKPKNFTLKIPLYFSEVFEIPKDFLQKVLWSGLGADSPNIKCYKKHGNAVLFISLQKMKEDLYKLIDKLYNLRYNVVEERKA